MKKGLLTKRKDWYRNNDMMRKKTWVLYALIFIGFALLLKAQEIDSFYTRLLNEGEASFRAGNFRKAVKELTIAVFGIEGHDDILGKAHVLLGLSYYYLDRQEESKNHLMTAAELIGIEEMTKVKLDSEKREDLSRILAYFGIGQEELIPDSKDMTQPETSASPSEEEPNEEAALRNKIQELNTYIKENPKEKEPYYELHEIYLKEKQERKAKKTLEDLTKQVPLETRSLFLLGVMHFKEKNFKKSEYYFSRIFVISQSSDVPSEIMEPSHAFNILSFYYRGKKEKAYELAESQQDALTEEKINQLDLEETNRRVLLEIMKNLTK